MPVGSDTSPAGRGQVLDACYGDKKGAGWPAVIEIALFAGDPTATGVELTGDGYARVLVPNNSIWFPDCAAAHSYKKLLAPPTYFPVATGDWTAADYWAFFDHTSGALLHSGQILDVGGTPTPVSVLTGEVARIPANCLSISET